MRTDYTHLNGPPTGCLGTVGFIMARLHDDMPNVAAAIFDWPGTIVPGKTPSGMWGPFPEEDVDLIQHCQKPAPCICDVDFGDYFIGPVLAFGDGA